MTLPINPFKRLAKQCGVKRISWKACEFLAKSSEAFALELIKSALEVVKSDKRTTLLVSDVELAYKIKKGELVGRI